jgi:hypothetical protein
LRLTVDFLTRRFLHDLSEVLRRTRENHASAAAHCETEQKAASHG